MARWLRGNWSRLFVALLLSLLAHLWLAGGLHFVMPERETADTIMVRLVTPPPAKPARPPAAAKPVAAKPPARPKPRPAPQPQPEPEPAPLAEPSPPPVAEAPPVQQPSPVPAEEPPLEPPEIEEPTPVVEQAYIPPEEEKSPPPPRHVEIDFQVLRKGGTAGVERQKYQAADDGGYMLESVIEPKGLLALALSDLAQKSEGVVTGRGLRPSAYLYQYGRNEDKARRATFDWQAGTLTLETGAKRRTAELLEGAQDMLSFMYQFMFVPPLQEMQLAVTNGRKLKIYNYQFEGEETLETRVGQLRAWHIGRGSGEGEEKIELWLAVDYHYLPVKINLTEKDGTLTERIVTRLHIE